MSFSVKLSNTTSYYFFKKEWFKCILKSLLFFLFIHFCTSLRSQPYSVIDYNYSYFVEQSVIESTNFHSGLKPFSLADIKLDSSNRNLLLFNKIDNSHFQPYISLAALGRDRNAFELNTSAGISLRTMPIKKLFIQFTAYASYSNLSSYNESDLQSRKLVPHHFNYIKRSGHYYLFPEIYGTLTYKPHKYIGISAGLDKFFIGDGYRSLLLSDNAAAIPFLNLAITAGRFKYLAMWAYLPDYLGTNPESSLHNKYTALHYVSYNLTSRFSFGFFESIVWKGRDTANYRGFDWAYLNPLIFYRPVEYSMHSPDNASMGGSLKVRLWRKTFLYSQLFLDDLIVKELRAQKGWWGNKYGIQAGFKCYNIFTVKHLFLQAEHNFVQPYTYSHSSSLLNYGYLYQPLAHPLGANFKENICILHYNWGKWLASAKFIYTIYGADSSETSMGSNIYKSYNTRVSNYNVHILQGARNTLSISDLRIQYYIKPEWNMAAFAGYKYYGLISTGNQLSNHIFTIGISTELFNTETDY